MKIKNLMVQIRKGNNKIIENNYIKINGKTSQNQMKNFLIDDLKKYLKENIINQRLLTMK